MRGMGLGFDLNFKLRISNKMNKIKDFIILIIKYF